MRGITSAKVQLAVGLPLTWVNRQRDEFRRYVLQRNSVDFKYEDNLCAVKIEGWFVFPQGYAAVTDYLKEMNSVNLIADIGNGTINVMYINNHKLISTQSHTEKLGVNQCAISAHNAVLDKPGVNIDESISEYADRIFDMLRRCTCTSRTVAVS